MESSLYRLAFYPRMKLFLTIFTSNILQIASPNRYFGYWLDNSIFDSILQIAVQQNLFPDQIRSLTEINHAQTQKEEKLGKATIYVVLPFNKILP